MYGRQCYSTSHRYSVGRGPEGVVLRDEQGDEASREQFEAEAQRRRIVTSWRMAVLRKRKGSQDVAKRKLIELARGSSDDRQADAVRLAPALNQSDCVVLAATPRNRTSHRANLNLAPRVATTTLASRLVAKLS